MKHIIFYPEYFYALLLRLKEQDQNTRPSKKLQDSKKELKIALNELYQYELYIRNGLTPEQVFLAGAMWGITEMDRIDKADDI